MPKMLRFIRIDVRPVQDFKTAGKHPSRLHSVQSLETEIEDCYFYEFHEALKRFS